MVNPVKFRLVAVVSCFKLSGLIRALYQFKPVQCKLYQFILILCILNSGRTSCYLNSGCRDDLGFVCLAILRRHIDLTNILRRVFAQDLKFVLTELLLYFVREVSTYG